MKKKNIISVDCDGTILDENSVLNDYTYDVLKKLSKDNIVIINTGRSIDEIYDLFGDRDFIGDYFVCNQGAKIYQIKDDVKIFKSFDIEREDILNIFNEFKNSSLDELHINGENIVDFEDIDKISENFSFVTLWGNSVELEKINSLLLKNSNLNSFLMRNSYENNQWIYITNAKANKGYAVKYIIDKNNLEYDNIICIGDSINDVPMLEVATIKVAMGNAIEEMKNICDFVAPSYTENGAAKWLEQNVLEQNNIKEKTPEF